MHLAGCDIADRRGSPIGIDGEDLRASVQDGGGGTSGRVARITGSPEDRTDGLRLARLRCLGATVPTAIVWPLWGVWLYDFITYYHDRPERIRHLYAVTRNNGRTSPVSRAMGLDAPALAWEIFRMTKAH
jgi:hypothetical protein